MFRCVALVAALAVLPAGAQVARTFPAATLRGELVVVQPPEVRLNGVPARLAPGARIFDQHNLLQLSGALIGHRLVVNYTHDFVGQPLKVWILTPAERARVPWPITDAQAQAWSFDAAAQVWSRP